MSEVIMLARDAGAGFAVEGRDVRLVRETRLGVAKLQILSADPDGWFTEALGIASPPVLREIEPAPVACAWLAPGEWLVTGPEEDVERVRSRCADIAGGMGLMTDLSQARASFELSGAVARTVIASHCPLDLSDEAMPVGSAMRSTFADTGFFISRRPDREGLPCFRLIFDQTMAGYAGRLLATTISGA